MEELKINHQLVYFDYKNALGVSFNLLTFGLIQLSDAYCIKNREALNKLVAESNPEKVPDINILSPYIFYNLIDSIKITICFENYFKSLLLLNGYVVHKLDKNVLPDLFEFQKRSPLLFSDIKKDHDWWINEKINTPIYSLKHQIKGITPITLGMNVLTNKCYYEFFNMKPEIISLCVPYFSYRNNLHYYTGESYSLHKNSYNDITRLIDFVNNNIVRMQNEIATKLSKPDNSKVQAV